MKRFKAFGARRRRSFELPSRMAPPEDVPTQDTQVRKLSQVVGIDSPPPASSPRHDAHHGTIPHSPTDPSETNAKVWKTTTSMRGKDTSRGTSFSSASDAPHGSLSSRLSDASLASTSGMGTNVAHLGDSRRVVVVAFDANARDAVVAAVAWALEHALRRGDLLALVGVMDFVRGPLGYKCQVNDQTWLGANERHLQKELAWKKHAWAATPGLQALCDGKGVKLVVSIKAAAHPEVAIVQDAVALGAEEVVLDRSLKCHTARKQKYYFQHLSCGMTRMRRSGGVETLRSNQVAPVAAPAANATSDDEELFSIDHCVETSPTHMHRGPGDGDEEGYESDDLFSICDDEGAWRTSSFATQRGDPECPARNSSVAAFDRDRAVASFVPPRSSVDSGPQLDQRLLSLRLHKRD